MSAELRVVSERDQARLTLALIAQPLVTAAIAYVAFPVVHWSGRPLYGASQYSSDAPLAFAVGVGIAAVVVVAGGVLPALWWLRRRGPVRGEHALVAGFVLGNAPYLLLMLYLTIWSVVSGRPYPGSYGAAGVLRGLLIGSTIGGLSAAVFWWMAPRQRTVP